MPWAKTTWIRPKMLNKRIYFLRDIDFRNIVKTKIKNTNHKSTTQFGMASFYHHNKNECSIT
jgi:hypothetical protein